MKFLPQLTVFLIRHFAIATSSDKHDKQNNLRFPSASRNLRGRALNDWSCFDCSERNPCAPSLYTADVYHYSHCNDSANFVVCGAGGHCAVKACPVGLRWESKYLVCNYPSIESESSSKPSAISSLEPSQAPSLDPTSKPSAKPGATPSSVPTSISSLEPSVMPSSKPSLDPSSEPSSEPTLIPSDTPNNIPSLTPSLDPTSMPSLESSATPSLKPSSMPSSKPSSKPTLAPNATPSDIPSSAPSSEPTSMPSLELSVKPSSRPSSSPASKPSPGSSVCFACNNDNSPCSSIETTNKYYFSHCDAHKYIQCSESGQCLERECPPDTRWNDSVTTCDHEFL